MVNVFQKELYLQFNFDVIILPFFIMNSIFKLCAASFAFLFFASTTSAYYMSPSQDVPTSARQLRAQTKANRISVNRLQGKGRRVLEKPNASQITKSQQNQSVILKNSRARLLRGRLNRNSDLTNTERNPRLQRGLQRFKGGVTNRRSIEKISKRRLISGYKRVRSRHLNK